MLRSGQRGIAPTWRYERKSDTFWTHLVSPKPSPTLSRSPSPLFYASFGIPSPPIEFFFLSLSTTSLISLSSPSLLPSPVPILTTSSTPFSSPMKYSFYSSFSILSFTFFLPFLRLFIIFHTLLSVLAAANPPPPLSLSIPFFTSHSFPYSSLFYLKLFTRSLFLLHRLSSLLTSFFFSFHSSSNHPSFLCLCPLPSPFFLTSFHRHLNSFFCPSDHLL